jgi:predicted metal-dependent phosphoesterase TrpH
MTIADEIAALPSGARFYRADLHIHSYSASHDVRDLAMTPRGIVDTSLVEGLALIAVTDHNDISNIVPTFDAAKGRGLFAVPGVELSTLEGHLLVYF